MSRPRRGDRDDDDDDDETELDPLSVASATGAAARATAASTPTSARRVASVSSVPPSSSSFFSLPGRRCRVAGGSMTSVSFFSDLSKRVTNRVTVSGSPADRARRRWLSRARGLRSRGRAMGTKSMRARVSAIGPRVLAVDAIPRRRRRLGGVADSATRGGKCLQRGCDWVCDSGIGIRLPAVAHQCRHAAHGCNIVIVYG